MYELDLDSAGGAFHHLDNQDLLSEENCMVYNLKACPFCGGRPYIESGSRGFYRGESTRVAFVRCTECNARSNRIPISIGQAKAVQAVVNQWNCRFDAISYEPCSDHRH